MPTVPVMPRLLTLLLLAAFTLTAQDGQSWILTLLPDGVVSRRGAVTTSASFELKEDSDAIVWQIEGKLKKEGVAFAANGDGIGTAIKAVRDRTSCVIRVAESDSLRKTSGVKIECVALPEGERAVVSIPLETPTTTGAASVTQPAPPKKSPEPSLPGMHTVEYSITGDTRVVAITGRNAAGGTEQHEVSVPYDFTLYVRGRFFAYLSAQKKSKEGSINVQIRVDGRLLQEASASSPYGIATASGVTQ